MSTNMEPIVNNLMKNSTSANFMNSVDVNLLNPYRNINLYPGREENNLKGNTGFNKKTDPKKSILEEFQKFPDFSGILPTQKKKSHPKPPKTSKKMSMNIFDNIDKIQNMVKNKTLIELEKIKDSPIEIPQRNSIKSNSQNQKSKTAEKISPIFDFSLPIIGGGTNDNFKLLNFKEKNKAPKSIFDT